MAPRWLRGPAVASLVVVSACGSGGNPDPTITALEPDRVTTRSATPAVLSGKNFFAGLSASLDTAHPPRVDRAWTVDIAGTTIAGDGVELRDTETMDLVIPAGLPSGTHAVSITSPTGASAVLAGALTVLDDADLELVIEGAPGGEGAPIEAVVLLATQTVDLHAVGRRGSTGEFLAPVEVTWTLSGEGGAIDFAAGTRTRFRAVALGTSFVIAEHPYYGSDSTGSLIVGVCTEPADCADPCYSQATCTAGQCDLGPADLDADGDGHVDAACPGGDDCDDDPSACGASCFPGNPSADVCDGVDQDCDQAIDEDPDRVWFEDADNDGFGEVTEPVVACNQPPGHVADSTDCDDDPLACGAGCFPGNPAADVCDGADQDCDTSVDENPELVWYADDDGDTYGDPTSPLAACIQPMGHVADDQDCADDPVSDPDCNGFDGALCNPGELEGPPAAPTCTDGADNDCDGEVDPFDTGCCPGVCGACSSGCCVDRCDAAPCTLICAGTSCACGLDCESTAGTCTTSCISGSTCSVDCSGGNNCDASCTGGSICDMDCTGANNCGDTICTSGAQCLLRCEDANNCTFMSCAGGQASCSGDIIVCNRPCP